MSQKKQRENRLTTRNKQNKLYLQWINGLCNMKLKPRIQIANSILRGVKQKTTHAFIMMMVLVINSLIWIGIGGLVYHFFLKK